MSSTENISDRMLCSLVYRKAGITENLEAHYKLDCAHKRNCLRENVRRIYQTILKSYEPR